MLDNLNVLVIYFDGVESIGQLVDIDIPQGKEEIAKKLDENLDKLKGKLEYWARKKHLINTVLLSLKATMNEEGNIIIVPSIHTELPHSRFKDLVYEIGTGFSELIFEDFMCFLKNDVFK